jgi:hypothetical protein
MSQAVRRHPHLLARGGVAALALLMLSSASAYAVSFPGWKPTGGPMGHIAFTGQLKGSKTLPRAWTSGHPGLADIATCDITSDGPTSLQFTLLNAKLAVDGHLRKVDEVFMTLNVTKDGDTETLAPTNSIPMFEASTSVTAYVGHASYVWASDAGTVTTNHTGKLGSLQATLVPATTGNKGAATRKITLKLSWTRCSALGQPA